MRDETACIVTHRQILEGLCPMCDRVIENGQVSDKSNGPSEIRWNWVALEECLRDRDSPIRSHTVWHLSSMAKSIDKALPLLALALSDSDPEIGSRAEDACGRIGRDLSDEQVVWLETQRDKQGRAWAARAVLLGK